MICEISSSKSGQFEYIDRGAHADTDDDDDGNKGLNEMI